MLAKDKCLKKIKYIIFLIIFIIPPSSFAKNIEKEILEYNNSLKNTSTLFIQTDGNTIEEGIIYIGENRIKIDYLKPKKISLILSEKKGMYIDHELQETQFFNVEKSHVSVFLKVLIGKNIFKESELKTMENQAVVKHNFELEELKYTAEIIYENNPLKIRKIRLLEKKVVFEMGFFNNIKHENNDKKFFALISPYIN